MSSCRATNAKTIGTIIGRRRRTTLVVDDAVREGYMRVVRRAGVVSVYASAASWTANAAANIAAAARPEGVP